MRLMRRVVGIQLVTYSSKQFVYSLWCCEVSIHNSAARKNSAQLLG